MIETEMMHDLVCSLRPPGSVLKGPPLEALHPLRREKGRISTEKADVICGQFRVVRRHPLRRRCRAQLATPCEGRDPQRFPTLVPVRRTDDRCQKCPESLKAVVGWPFYRSARNESLQERVVMKTIHNLPRRHRVSILFAYGCTEKRDPSFGEQANRIRIAPNPHEACGYIRYA